MIHVPLAAKAAVVRPVLVRLCAFVMVAVLLGGPPARAAEPLEDQYLKLMTLMDRADMLREKGETEAAKAKYIEAEKGLLNIRKAYPSWNSKVLSFRLNYVAEKLNSLTPTNAPVAAEASGGKTSGGGAGPKLLSNGAEPRQALRLSPKAGDKQSVLMTVLSSMDMGPMGQMKVPAMKLPMDITVLDVSSGGDITYEMVMGTMEVADDPGSPIASAMKTALGEMGGVTMTNVISSRGLHKSVAVNTPKDASSQAKQVMDQMQQSMGNISFTFPEEPVGVGAKWEVKQPIKSQGMSINQTLTLEIVSIQDGKLEVKTTTTQTAPTQKIESPMAPGMKMDVTKFAGSGTGKISWNLASVQPSQANTETHTEITMSLNLGGQKQNMTVKADSTVTVESK